VSSISGRASETRYDHQAQLPPLLLQPGQDFVQLSPSTRPTAAPRSAVWTLCAQHRQSQVEHLAAIMAAEMDAVKTVTLDASAHRFASELSP